MTRGRAGFGKAWTVLVCAALSAWVCLAPRPGKAQQVVDFGGQTPCASWLSNPNATRQGLAWLSGAWSGLNLAAGLSHDADDVGHTLNVQTIAGAVEAYCRQDMTKTMSQAVLQMYVAARAANR